MVEQGELTYAPNGMVSLSWQQIEEGLDCGSFVARTNQVVVVNRVLQEIAVIGELQHYLSAAEGAFVQIAL